MSFWRKSIQPPSSTQGVFSLDVMKKLSRVSKRAGKKRGKKGRQFRQQERHLLRRNLYQEKRFE